MGQLAGSHGGIMPTNSQNPALQLQSAGSPPAGTQSATTAQA